VAVSAGGKASAGCKAVFLDKDGTVIDDIPYNVDPRRMTLARGAAEGLHRLSGMAYHLLMVSNQPGVALGYFSEAALDRVARELARRLGEEGAPLAGFYYCPHHPEGTVPAYARRCDCRKPMPGMLLSAAAEHDIDLHRSWMIGDILDDVEAGRRAGCRTVLIDNGNETVWRRSPLRQPDLTARDLAEAARLVAAADGAP
jgi:D-glycero-D-manno-heptose 1,7-bisphosphate phosphatase